MVVEESIHIIFDESNNSLQERQSFDDDLGLETSMGKLKIEDRRQQEKVVEDPKKEESPLTLPHPQQVQGESSQDLPKDWKFVINHPQDQIIEFSKCMHSEFEMSMMGEFNFFLGLQIKQLKEGTFINQAKYIRDLLKRLNMEEAKTMKTPMSSSIKLDMDEKGKLINSTMYRDMIGHSLVSWHSKKQNSVALSTAEAEYITAGLCCAQILWMKQTLGDFNLIFEHVPIKCDNTSAINISKNPGFGLVVAPSYLISFSFWTPPSPFHSLDGSKARDGHLRKARYDTTLFSSVENYQRYKQKFAQRKVVPGRSVNFSQLQHFGFKRLFDRMGWLPVVTISESIFPTLVLAFYSRATYGLGGPILSTVRGVEIRLSPKSIYRILGIPSVGLQVYEPRRGHCVRILA
ncbi:hypothetical protein CK203_040012 [Vitis vinifera]|uniref:Reverse transcriptase Ty1/copia-type domain-containing protein n=1 Tax=Vitis vinifera TaxID=29760 RepID=A0A438IE22_VITVI|nr:hypothetical protein CK203_040012 [Vitis vinifera]